jgi:anaerobic glycerol-3-phosphate dehydrogenase
MLPVDASGQTSGTVTGATGGVVQIYRELPHAARELVATSPVAADGSFHASGLGSSDDNLYRAVYIDPVTTVPFSFLPGVPVGVGGS